MTVRTLQAKNWNPASFRQPVIKPLLKAFDWAEVLAGTLPKFAKDSRKLLSRVSDGLGVFSLPGRGRKLRKSFTLAYSAPTIGEKAVHSVDALSLSTSMIGVGTGALETLHEAEILTLSPFQILILSIFGFICTSILIAKTLSDINKTFTHIKNEELWSPKFKCCLFALAGKICRLVLGIFAMAFFLSGGQIVAPIVLLTISSISLCFSLAKKRIFS